MNVLVFGAGASGRAAAALLKTLGANVAVLDGDDEYPRAGEWDYAVTSPGVPLTHRWHAEAAKRNIPVISELELAAGNWKGRILAVTGSKGKSSVVKLVADTLNASGRKAVACGNYGIPFCDVVLDAMKSDSPPMKEWWAVVEVSSFQMETTHRLDCEAAAVLNLQEDHLDRHGSVEVYHALKLKLLDGATVKILPPAHGAAMPDELFRGTYFDNSVLMGNAFCAVGMMRAAGLGDEEISRGFKNFVPLKHRMQTLADICGVKYIDDSKATSLAAMAAGVRMTQSMIGGGKKIHLIAGGLAKGDDPDFVISHLSEAVKKVYLIGSCAEQFFNAWHGAVSCTIYGTLDCAVEAAKREVREGEAVLLSPGTASFDQFKSYGARGDKFASLVKGGGVKEWRRACESKDKNK